MIDLNLVRPSNTPLPVSIEAPPVEPVRLDLGCGQNKREGFKGVDFAPASGVDVVHDLLSFPWPFDTSSVDEINCQHFFEHVPAKLRPRFMEEVYRVLKHGGTALFVTPAAWSNRAVQDFTHEWPPVVVESYLYFSKAWREANRLTHGFYDIKADLVGTSIGVVYNPALLPRNDEYRNHAQTHYLNALVDLHVTLQAVK